MIKHTLSIWYSIIRFINRKKLNKTDQNGEPLSEETYLSTRQAYNKDELEVSGRYDQWILTLSGGALGLSITFIEKIAKNPTTDTLFWLKFSWVFLVISLLSALFSLVTSQSAIRENRAELELAYSENRAPRLEFPKWFTRTTNILNWSSSLFFILGVIFLCVFSFKNIDQSISNGGEKNGPKTSTTTNQDPPNATSRCRICPTCTATTSEGQSWVCPASTTTTKEKIEIK